MVIKKTGPNQKYDGESQNRFFGVTYNTKNGWMKEVLRRSRPVYIST